MSMTTTKKGTITFAHLKTAADVDRFLKESARRNAAAAKKDLKKCQMLDKRMDLAVRAAYKAAKVAGLPADDARAYIVQELDRLIREDRRAN
jgi:hypothetical protein